MKTQHWFLLLLAGCLLAGSLAGAAAAATLGNEWKERAPEEGPYQGILIVPDASLIHAGGNTIYIRSWDHSIHWGYRPAQAAALSYDGKRVVLGEGTKLAVYDSKGVENWTRNMDGFIRAVAVSPNGSFVISADEKGNYLSWNRNGEFVARTENATPKALTYSPTTDLIVAATEKGLRFYNRRLEVVWYDNRTEGRDQFVVIAGDGSTVITAGHKEVASYKNDGTLNWRYEVTREPIIDMDCSFDCSVIVVGGQDKEVVAIDKHGTVRWRFGTGQWVNAVGVSRDGSVIAAGGIDRTLTILDRSGAVVATKKTDAIIQPRSIAVSSDGRRFVVADQMNLYGFSMIGDTIAPDIAVTSAQEPLNPVPTTNPTPVPTAAETTVTAAATAPVTPTTTASVRPTTYAPVNPLLFLPALAAAGLLLRLRR